MAETHRRDHGLEGGWRLEGGGDGRAVSLVLGETRLRRAYPGLSVGRHPELNDMVLDDPSVSRRHFRISIEGETLFVEDLNSLNGTAVDGRALRPFAPVALAEGATLTAGAVTLNLVRVAE